jgi:hypothetical protein
MTAWSEGSFPRSRDDWSAFVRQVEVVCELCDVKWLVEVGYRQKLHSWATADVGGWTGRTSEI